MAVTEHAQDDREQGGGGYVFPPIGEVKYMLESDWLEPDGGECCIKRVEVVAHCESREAARQWMIEMLGR